MESRTQCQICWSSRGDEMNVSAGCVLRLDLENSLNFQLLVTVNSLTICPPCYKLIELWSLFAARARKNLAAVSQDSTQSSGNTKRKKLKTQVQNLSKKLKQVLQSTDVAQICTITESSGDSNAMNGNIAPHCAISTLVHPDLKACSIALDRSEVERYFMQRGRPGTLNYSSCDEAFKVEDCEEIENSTNDSQESPCILEMKFEIESEPPSPVVENLNEVGSAPPKACSSILLTETEVTPDNWVVTPVEMSFTNNYDESSINQEQSSTGIILRNLLQTGLVSLSYENMCGYNVDQRKQKDRGEDGENKNDEQNRPRTENEFILSEMSKSVEVSNMPVNQQNFSSESDTVSYSRRHKSKTLTPRNCKLYYCDICQITFTRNSLGRHLQSNLHKTALSEFKSFEGDDNQIHDKVSNSNPSVDILNPNNSAGDSSSSLIPEANFSNVFPTTVVNDSDHHIFSMEKANTFTKFSCITCHKNFRNQQSLSRHWQSNLHKARFDALCPININHERASECLVEESTQVFGNCDFCGKSFYSKQHLTEHIYTHLKEGKAFCYSCKMIFRTPFELQDHVGQLKCRNLSTWQCNVCSIKLSTSGTYREHVLHCHNIKFTPYGRKKIAIHHQRKRKRKYRKYPEHAAMSCHICSKSYRYQRSLASHILTEHASNRKPSSKNVSALEVGASLFGRDLTDDLGITNVSALGVGTSLLGHDLTDDLGITNVSALGVGTSLLVHAHGNEPTVDLSTIIDPTLEFQSSSHEYNLIQYVEENNEEIDVEVDESPNMYLTCTECSLQFPNMFELQLHITNVHNTEEQADYKSKFTDTNIKLIIYQCDICNKRLNRKYALEKHIERHMKQVSGLKKCNFCSKQFSTRHNIIQHMYTHLRERKSFCYSCNMTFNTPVELVDHVTYLKCKQIFTWQCNMCFSKLSSRKTYREHVGKFHNIKLITSEGRKPLHDQEKPTMKCCVCDRHYRLKSSLRRHILAHHKLDPKLILNLFSTEHTGNSNEKMDGGVDESQKLSLTCSYCSLQYPNTLELQKHISSVHIMEGSENETCKNLMKHNEEKSSLKQCEICSKQFSLQENIIEHMKTHLIEGKSLCYSCYMIFNTPAELGDHIAHFKCKNLYTWQCNVCSTKLSFKKTYRDHLRYIHNIKLKGCIEIRDDEVSGSDLKKQQQQLTKRKRSEYVIMDCCICDKSYRHRSSLSRHILTVHKLDPKLVLKSCSKRDYDSTQSNEKMDGEVGESSEINLTCSECYLYFSNMSELRLHRVNMHNIEENETNHNEEILSLKKCDYCSEQFSTWESITQHMYSHLNERKHFCLICKKIFDTSEELEGHTAYCKHPSTCQCCVCSKASKRTYEDHASEDVTVKQKISSLCPKSSTPVNQTCFSCVVCNKLFDQKCHSELDSHLVNEHNLNSDLICNLYTKNGYMFDNGNGKKYFECVICNATFGKSFCIRSHLKDVHKIALLHNVNDNVKQATENICQEIEIYIE